jgi:hypothetical protein
LVKATISLQALGFAILLAFTTFGSASAQSEISDDKLQAFVTAAVSVSKVIEQWTPRLVSAKSHAVAEDLLAQAHADLIAAIEEAGGITPQEYEEIFHAARSDPVLSARIEELLQRSSSHSSQ